MIYRTLDEIRGTERDVHGDTFQSRRLLLRRDGRGYSFHDTVLRAGTETYIWYTNHVESVYCIEGEGEVETVPHGVLYPISPGVLYVLDRHEKHYLRARTDLRVICVFTPALTGTEVHDEYGTYPLLDDSEPKAAQQR